MWLSNTKYPRTAEWVLSDVLNKYCREFSNWSTYAGVPRYDAALARQMRTSETHLHLRLDFAGAEVFVALHYFSDTGLHRFGFPAFVRWKDSQEIDDLSAEALFALILEKLETEGVLLDRVSPTVLLQHYFARWEAIRKLGQELEHGIGHQVSVQALESLAGQEGSIPLLVSLIRTAANGQKRDIREAALEWFAQYLQVVFPVLVANLQSGKKATGMLVQLNESGLPVAIRQEWPAGEGESNVPDLELEKQVLDFFTRHIARLIGLVGNFGLCSERDLLRRCYDTLSVIQASDSSGICTLLLCSRYLETEGELLGDLVYYKRKISNFLHLVFLAEAVTAPPHLDEVCRRFFEKEGITITIRPLDVENDLEMLHHWFHRDHAKAIWKMDWSLKELELFYRTLLPGKTAHSYIGEINGEPTFNLEVYWATRDVVGDYYEVLPDDYGTHLLIATTEKHKKYPSQTMQAILDWLFAQKEIGRLIGEGDVASLPALMNKLHVGFRLQGVIDMPHKKAHLNICYREWYWEKFPENAGQAWAKENKCTERVVAPAVRGA